VDNYFFKLVCVDDNPIGYSVLEDVNIENLEKVHEYVQEHIQKHAPEYSKWMLIPMKKSTVS